MEQKSNIETQLRTEGYIVSTTVGYSMWPMLKNRRDRVIIYAYETGSFPKQNDLILYRRDNGKYILHRALWVDDECCIVRGDNTYRLEIVRFGQILGRVTEFYRKDRHHTVDSGFYKAYVWTWRILFPIRALLRGLKFIIRHCGSLAKRILKKILKK